jgi:hypothetical protein
MESFPDWNLYDELGIAPAVSVKVVRAVYRALIVERHPDTNPDDPAATERMRRLNYAHEVLADDERRAGYDRFLRDGVVIETASEASPEGPFVVAADGSGTHRTIGAAIADAADGTTIRLRPGTYRETVDVNASLRFEVDDPVGAATIAAARGDVVSVRGGTVRFHGIAFQHDGPDDDSQTPCAFTVLGGDVTLDACAVNSAHNGIWLQESGSRLALRDTFVEAVLWAVYAHGESVLDLSGCTIVSREQNGLHNDGARLTATSSLIQDCGQFGCAASGGSTRLELCEIRRCKEDGVITSADLELIGCAVHDNQNSGVLVNPGAASALERCTIYRNGSTGIWIARSTVPVRIEGCLIGEETTAVSTYAPTTVADCAIVDCSEIGLAVQAGGGDLTVHGSSIERCRAGAHLEEGTAASFVDCIVAGCSLLGIEADDGARLHVTGGTIYDCNVGILANRSGVELHGATIAANGQGGVQHNGAALRVSSCTIRGNRGRGIDRYAGGSLDLRGSDLSGNAGPFEPARATAVRLTQAGNVFVDTPADWRPDPYIGGRDFQRSHTFRFYGSMEAVVGAVSAFARAHLYDWQNDGSSVEPDGRLVSFAFRRTLSEPRLVKPTGSARIAAGIRAYQGKEISAVAPVRYELRASCTIAKLDEFRAEVSLLVIEHIGASAGAYNLDAHTAPAWTHTEGYPGVALDGFLSNELIAALPPAVG